ncbi:MAG: glycosyltransferase [Anaerolineae bacterium]
MISKALVVGAYRRKLEELACQPDIELTAIVPPAWREGRQHLSLETDPGEGYQLIIAPIVFNGQHHIHFYPTLGRLLAVLRPDVLHVDEEPYNLVTWHALRLGHRLGAQGLFFTWQNLYRRYPWPFSYFERVSYRLSSYAIAGNQAAAAVLRRKGFRGRVAIIPQFGIDPQLFTPSPACAGGRTSALVIGFAGRLVPEKGIAVLMRACAELPFQGWTLHLLGNGPAQAQFAALARKLGIADRVHFWGHLPSLRVVDFYRSLDVLVLPSLSQPNWIEQFGRVLIEAMACGVPVIGSDSGEIPHVIGDAGLVFPEGDAHALAGLLADLAASPERRAELAAQGRARVLARFTQAQVAADTARVYREVLSGNSRQSSMLDE